MCKKNLLRNVLRSPLSLLRLLSIPWRKALIALWSLLTIISMSFRRLSASFLASVCKWYKNPLKASVRSVVVGSVSTDNRWQCMSTSNRADSSSSRRDASVLLAKRYFGKAQSNRCLISSNLLLLSDTSRNWIFTFFSEESSLAHSWSLSFGHYVLLSKWVCSWSIFDLALSRYLTI